MDAKRWQAIAAIAEQAVDLDEAERLEFVAAQKTAQPELADDLEQVIEALGDADGFASSLSNQLADLLDPTALRPGDTLGAYTIDRALGWGGMGTVYLARRSDDQYEKTVAIKMLPGQLADDAARERFIDERQILAELEHPAIARLIDGGVSPAGQPYYVLEYVDGETAERYARDADVNGVLDVFTSMCDAVSHAHSKLVIHCDLKPANVLVTRDGHVKLLDFGIARMIGDTESRPAFGYLNTPVTRNYAAPELIEGRSVDTRADVYSLGILLFRLLSGRQPYELPPGSLAEIRAGLDTARRDSLRREGKLAALPAVNTAELAAVIDRATALDRDARYASVHELASDVRRIRAGHLLAVPPPGVRVYRLRKAARRNPIAAALAASAAALAVATLVTLVVALVVTRAEKARTEVANARLAAERETAIEVTEFLVSVFDAADPELRKADAAQVTARELVESGIARIERARLSNPVVAARLDLTIGRIAHKIGELDSAKKLLARAVEHTDDDESTRRALLELGIAQGSSGQRAEGLATLQTAIDRCEAAGDERCVLEALRSRGSLEIDDRQFDAARATLSQAIARGNALATPTSKDRGLVAYTTYGLAIAEHRAGNSAEAQKLFSRSRALFDELDDDPTLDAARSFLTLGVLENVRGEYAAAAERLRKARSIFVELYGPRHLRVAYVDFVASNVYAELGDIEAARVAAETALSIRRDVLGDAHADTGMAWGRLADVLDDLDDLDGALDAGLRSRAITKESNRGSYANVGLVVSRLHAALGDPAEALAVARESLAIYEELYGAEHAMASRGHAAVAAARAAAGELDAAVASQRHAIALADRTIRPDHPRRVGLYLALGELEHRAGRDAEARITLEQARDLGIRSRPPQPAQVQRAQRLLDQIGR